MRADAGCSICIPSPTVWTRSPILRRSSARQPASSCAFRSARSFAFGTGTQVIAPEVSGFAFHTAFLVALAGCAELGLKLPMRPKCDEPFGPLHAGIPAGSSSPRWSGCHNAAARIPPQNIGNPTHGPQGMPVLSPEDKPDGMRHHCPCSACRTPGASAVRHPTPRRLRTSRSVLPDPRRSFAARTSPVG